MAFRGRRQKEEEPTDKTIDINAQMQGSLTFADPVNLKITGNFQGTLNTKGTLTIGAKAIVEADIQGDNIIIAGQVTGDLLAKTMLVLMPTAVFNGKISTPKLNIVEGAIFQGQCNMIKNEGLLDIDEVAKYLEIDLSDIEALVNSGKIPAKKSDDGWKFERDKIDNWAASIKVQ